MTLVTDLLPQMPAVRQPQRKFLAVLFATILALRGRVTGRNLSRSCEDSERTMARQFRASFAWTDFHQRVMTAALDPHAELISVQDTSVIPKSGKQTFGLGHFFNGCASRAERGLEIATLAVVDVTRRCAFTLAVAQTPPGADEATSPQAAAETRMDFSKQQLRDQRQRLPERVTDHCVDGGFAKQKYLDEVVTLKLHPITTLRCDANCLFLYTGLHPQRRGPRRKYDGKVNFQDLHRFEYLGTLAEREHVHLYTALVWHGSLKRTLRGVVRVNRKDPLKPRDSGLASTELELDGHTLVEFYVARFQLACLLRDSKQFTGLADCQARAEAALDFHVNAALATLNLVRAEELLGVDVVEHLPTVEATLNLVRAEELLASPPQASQVFSMASCKQRYFNERLLDLFIESLALDPTWVKNHSGYDKLRTYGAIAA